MAYIKGEPFIPQFTDPATGQLMSGGTVEFYLSGTSTATPYYTDSTGTSGGTSLTLGTGGKPATDIFYDDGINYKLVIKDGAGSPLDTISNYSVVAATVPRIKRQYISDLTSESATVGNIYEVEDYAAGNNAGIMAFKAVAAATGTADGGSYIDHDTLAVQFERIFNSVVTFKDFGARGDGVADDTAACQAAMAYADHIDGGVGNYLLKSSLNITKSGQTISGSGSSTVFVIDPTAFTSAPFPALTTTTATDLTLKDFKVLGAGSGTGLNAGIDLFNSHRTNISRVQVEEADSFAIALVDCDHATVDGVYVENSDSRYAAGTASFGVELDGCGHCTVSNSHAKNVGFGFLVIGDDTPSGGTNGHRSTRTNEFATGNVVKGCTVKRYSSIAFDINAASNNVFSSCTATEQLSTSSDASFQNKHTSTNEARNNIFMGCTARDCAIGGYSQDGSNVVFSDFTVYNFGIAAVWLNQAPNSSISNLIAEDTAAVNPGSLGQTDKSIVRVEASSDVRVNGVTGKFSSTGVTYASGNSVGLSLINSDRTVVDNFITVTNGVQAVNIDSNSDFTDLLSGCKPGGAIVDAASNTQYPLQFVSETIDNSVAGSFSFGPNVAGGVNMGRISMIAKAAESGTNATISVGRTGNNAQFAAATGAPTVAGARTVMTIADATYSSSYNIFQGFCNGAATAGSTLIQVEGLALV